MKIDKVTITGADDRINYNDLLDLQEDFPFVEWGILFSEAKEGKSRYPSSEHRKKQFVGELNLSAHFCGWWARQVLEEGNLKLIRDLPPQYKRVQLNYNFERSDRWNLNRLVSAVEYNDDRRIIVQYNEPNKLFIDAWLSENNVPSKIHFLYDASGGKGKKILSIEPPIGGHYTGYAGGISLGNIDAICCEIGRTSENDEIWIDLESGARNPDDDQFNLTLVRQILEKAKYHVILPKNNS